MAKPPEGDQIDDDIGAEVHAPIRCHFKSFLRRQRTVRIAMKNRGPEGFAQIGTIQRRPGIPGIRRKSHLVIQHNMNGSTHIELGYLTNAKG